MFHMNFIFNCIITWMSKVEINHNFYWLWFVMCHCIHNMKTYILHWFQYFSAFWNGHLCYSTIYCVSDIKQCVVNWNYLNNFLFSTRIFRKREIRILENTKDCMMSKWTIYFLYSVWYNHAALSCHSKLMDSLYFFLIWMFVPFEFLTLN